MTMLFDTHCHLFMEPLGNDLYGVLKRASKAGVGRINVPAVNWGSVEQMSLPPGMPVLSCSLGIHPWWADEGADIPLLKRRLVERNACAVGEIGLDWKANTAREKQISIFTRQLRLAVELDLPVILHCRSAFEEMLDILKDNPVKGVIHAWSRTPELMERFLDLGLHVSFGGALTRPGAARAAASAAAVPRDRFVLETDSPSMGMKGIPPGKTEPADVFRVASAMAGIRKVSVEALMESAWKNSTLLFGGLN